MAAALQIVLLIACSSSDGLVRRDIIGGPGQDISVGVVDLESPVGTLDLEGTRLYTVHIEISNNSDVPLTVMKITIGPSESLAAFRVEGSSRAFNEMIDPGKDHVFQVPLRGRLFRDFRPEERRIVEFNVIAELSNNDSYIYTFEGPVRDIYSPPH